MRDSSANLFLSDVDASFCTLNFKRFLWFDLLYILIGIVLCF